MEQGSTGGRFGIRAWLVTAGAVAIAVVASFIPLPGIDHEMLAAASAQGGGLAGLFSTALPALSVTSLGLMSLMLVRGAVAVLEGTVPGESKLPWRLIGFGVFLLLCLIQAAGIVLWLESVDASSWGAPVVLSPGWGFRLTAVGGLVGGAVLMWALATWISRAGIGSGPLVLFGVWGVWAGLRAFFEQGRAVGLQMLAPVHVVLSLVDVAPLVLVAFALWRWPRPSWPVPLWRDLRLRSSVDLLVLPYLAGLVPTFSGQIGWLFGARTPLPLELIYVGGFLATMAAAALLIWWRRGPRADSRRAGWLLLAVLAPVLSVLALAGGFQESGGLDAAFTPGPFEGDAAFEVTLLSDGGDGAADGAALVRRLEALDVHAEVVSAARGRIELRVEEIADAREALREVLPRRHLAFHLVAEDQGPLAPKPGVDPPPGVRIGAAFEQRDGFVADDPDALEPIIAAAAIPAHRVISVECRTGDMNVRGEEPIRECCARLLEDPPILTGADVAQSRVQRDEYSGRPVVLLDFTRSGARTFADVTAAAVHRHLAIVVDGVTQSAPLIQERISGGRAQVTLGAGHDDSSLLREAEALSAALGEGALGASWELGEIRPIGS